MTDHTKITPEEQEGSEYWLSLKNGSSIPLNWSFTYRHVNHIGNIVQYPGGKDEHVAFVIEKYKNIDAGLNPDGTPKPEKTAQTLVSVGGHRMQPGNIPHGQLVREVERLQAMVDAAKAESEQSMAELSAKRDRLERELAELAELTAAEPKEEPEQPSPAPEQPGRKPKRPNRKD